MGEGVWGGGLSIVLLILINIAAGRCNGAQGGGGGGRQGGGGCSQQIATHNNLYSSFSLSFCPLCIRRGFDEKFAHSCRTEAKQEIWTARGGGPRWRPKPRRSVGATRIYWFRTAGHWKVGPVDGGENLRIAIAAKVTVQSKNLFRLKDGLGPCLVDANQTTSISSWRVFTENMSFI